jgi:glycosyltransferase involved in cell wall biosynthesis
MRILVFCDEDLSVAAGGARQVAELALGLQRLGHELRVVAPRPRSPIDRTTAYSQLELVRVPVLRRLGLRPLTFLALSGCILLFQIVRWKPDVIVWFDSPGQWAPLPCHVLTRCPYVLFVNGLPDEEVSGFWQWAPVRAWLQAVLKIAARRASAVVSICPEILDRMQKEWGIPRSQSAVVRNGVDVQEFHPIDCAESRRQLGLEAFGLYVGFVGGFFPWHHLDQLFDAVPGVLRSIPQARFILIGDGETRTDLEAKARRLGIESVVQFVGRVPFQSVPRWIAACDVCVVLHKPTRSYPGDSMKLWEYLACNRSVVATAGPGYGDFVEATGCGAAVKPDDHADLAHQIARLLRNSEGRTKMGARGRQAVMKDHTWEKRAEQLESIIQDCQGAHLRAKTKNVPVRRGLT